MHNDCHKAHSQLLTITPIMTIIFWNLLSYLLFRLRCIALSLLLRIQVHFLTSSLCPGPLWLYQAIHYCHIKSFRNSVIILPFLLHIAAVDIVQRHRQPTILVVSTGLRQSAQVSSIRTSQPPLNARINRCGRKTVAGRTTKWWRRWKLKVENQSTRSAWKRDN